MSKSNRKKVFRRRLWASRDTEKNGSSQYITFWNKKAHFQSMGVWCGSIRLKGTKLPDIYSVGTLDMEVPVLVDFGKCVKVELLITKTKKAGAAR